jgi:hypothetical protein
VIGFLHSNNLKKTSNLFHFALSRPDQARRVAHSVLERSIMAQSISISKFTAAVQAAVKAAAAKNPKFKMGVPNTVTVSYLIRGIPPPPEIVNSMADLQTFADEIAGHLAAGQTEASGLAAGAKPAGAVISVGRHIICGIPPIELVTEVRE